MKLALKHTDMWYRYISLLSYIQYMICMFTIRNPIGVGWLQRFRVINNHVGVSNNRNNIAGSNESARLMSIVFEMCY